MTTKTTKTSAPKRSPRKRSTKAPATPQEQEVMASLVGEHYATDDLILSELNLPHPCPIRIEITAEKVRLTIGQRDFDWNRGCPDLSGSGTMLSEPVPDDGGPIDDKVSEIPPELQDPETTQQ